MCAHRLYPDVPHPPIPPSVPLANHTGHYRHPAYDSIFVTLDCQDKATDAIVVSSPSDLPGENCRLRLKRGLESQLQLYGNLTHKTGDYWLSYVFEDWVDVVQACVRTQFRVDASGIVASVGIDMRLEEEDTPLVWFDRV